MQHLIFLFFSWPYSSLRQGQCKTSEPWGSVRQGVCVCVQYTCQCKREWVLSSWRRPFKAAMMNNRLAKCEPCELLRCIFKQQRDALSPVSTPPVVAEVNCFSPAGAYRLTVSLNASIQMTLHIYHNKFSTACSAVATEWSVLLRISHSEQRGQRS